MLLLLNGIAQINSMTVFTQSVDFLGSRFFFQTWRKVVDIDAKLYLHCTKSELNRLFPPGSDSQIFIYKSYKKENLPQKSRRTEIWNG